jgi:hypothetical protein
MSYIPEASGHTENGTLCGNAESLEVIENKSINKLFHKL